MVRSSDVIDRLEKIGRLVLWLTLAALAGMCILLPLSVRAQAKETARAAKQAAPAAGRDDAATAEGHGLVPERPVER